MPKRKIYFPLPTKLVQKWQFFCLSRKKQLRRIYHFFSTPSSHSKRLSSCFHPAEVFRGRRKNGLFGPNSPFAAHLPRDRCFPKWESQKQPFLVKRWEVCLSVLLSFERQQSSFSQVFISVPIPSNFHLVSDRSSGTQLLMRICQGTLDLSLGDFCAEACASYSLEKGRWAAPVLHPLPLPAC